MKPPNKKLLIRYPKEYFDKSLNSNGLIQIVNAYNEVAYIPEIAIIEESSSHEFKKGDDVVVQYLVAFDKTVFRKQEDKALELSRDIYQEDKRINQKYNELKAQMKDYSAAKLIQDWQRQKYILEQAVPIKDKMEVVRNQYFIQKLENGDELRWCNEDQIFGIKRNGKVIPTKDYVFCELPEEKSEMIGSFYRPDTYRNPDTDRHGFKTKIKYINRQTKKEYGLKENDIIWCNTNADAKKKLWDEMVIRVPIGYILAKES